MNMIPIGAQGMGSNLREIAIGVSDLEARSRFYRDHLGLREVARGWVSAASAEALWGCREAVETVVLARPELETATRIRLLAAEGEPARPQSDLSAPGPLGIGFTTREVREAHRRLAAAGVDFLSAPVELTPPQTGPAGPRRFEVFGRAADGEFLVLIERLNPPSPYGNLSEVSGLSEPLHASHVVEDLAASSRFMSEVLGHETLFRETLDGERFERLMGLAHGARLSFEMLHHPAFPTGRIIFIELEGSVSGTISLVAPPARGMCAHRYDSSDLDSVLARVEEAGGTLRSAVVEIDEPVLGRGRVATVAPPHGTLLELWEIVPRG
jgi:catechol 2,3-dioxygenase-like lactoylglutathione lyase family enzyme